MAAFAARSSPRDWALPSAGENGVKTIVSGPPINCLIQSSVMTLVLSTAPTPVSRFTWSASSADSTFPSALSSRALRGGSRRVTFRFRPSRMR